MIEIDPRYFEKLMRNLQSILEVYRRYSVIFDATNHRPFVEGVDEPSSFTPLRLKRMVPKEWFDKKSNAIPDLTEMGRSVAIEEEKFLLRKISDSFTGEVRKVPEVLPEHVNSAIETLIHRGLVPATIFAPVELYTAIHSWTDDRGHPYYSYPAGPQTFYVLRGIALRIFWSSIYSPLDRIVVYDKSFGPWIVKADTRTGGYLTIGLGETELDPTRFEITATTLAKLLPLKTTHASLIVPDKLPSIQK